MQTNYKHEAFIDIFTKLGEEAFSVWLSGKVLDGECKRWFANGQLMEHGFWEHGQLDGECKRWYENGQLMEHRFWKNGEVVRLPKNVKKGFILGGDGKFYAD